MPKSSVDPLRTRLHELTQEIEEHTAKLRDFAVAPGNAWLARGELQQLMNLMSDLESLIEDIKQQDAENGY
jgi:hypothetical protein